LRELLLAQASDWPFMLSRAVNTRYARERIRTHLDRCTTLCEGVARGTIDPSMLGEIETADNLFPNIDYRLLL
jgi:1,4-alpha-glucan branching enzyme